MNKFGKLSLPDKIKIGSEELDVILDESIGPLESRGSFNESKIFLGIKNLNKKRWAFLLSLFIHEVLEMILENNGKRFDNSNGDILFCLSHTDFSIICEELAIIMSEVYVNRRNR